MPVTRLRLAQCTAVFAAVFSFLFVTLPAPALDLGAGSLRGSVYDKDFSVPVAQARVVILEAGLATTTDNNGNFLFQRVPAGSYTLAFSKEGFERLIQTDVVVVPGQVADVRVDLVSEVFEMEELVVIGEDLFANAESGLLDIRADALTVQDAISADLISKAGAGDVAGAVKLVVGVSVADGKYATVRGLSDRYTGTTLNGVRVPSPDPRKRAVQIDIFPTGTIDSITVTKTFTPDQFGEFTGGAVDIKTKGIPEGKLLSVSQSYEYNSLATGSDNFLTYRDGGVKSSGIAGSSRELPKIARKAGGFQIPRFSQRPTQEQIDASNYFDNFTRAFSPVLGVSRNTTGTNFGFALNGGNRFELGTAGQLGVVGAVSYTHKYDLYENASNNSAGRTSADQGLSFDSKRNDSKGTDEVLWGLLGSVVYKPHEKHQLALRLIGNQSAEDEARLQTEQPVPNVEEFNQALRYVERSLRAAQLHGEHDFKRWLLNWTLAKNDTSQDEPDVRFFRYQFDQQFKIGNFLANQPLGNQTRRIFRKIDETNKQGGVDIAIPFTRFKDEPGRIKFGAYLDRSDRDFQQSSFTYFFPGVFGPRTRPDVIENRGFQSFKQEVDGQLWTDLFGASKRLGLATNNPFAANQLLWVLVGSGGDVPYTGNQEIDAAYAMAELPLTQSLSLIGGVRFEKTLLEVTPDTLTNEIEFITKDDAGNRGIAELSESEGAAKLDQTDRLPALGLIWQPIEQMNVRVNWSQTIARPTFRELAPVAAIEVLQGDEFFGNPKLQISHITNYDLRWEWFPTPGDVLAASTFYKSIENPIELISFGAAGRTFVQPVNYAKGVAYGLEIEARGSMQRFWNKLAGLTAGLNGTWLETKVDVPLDEQASLADFGLNQDQRRLAGQPEYLLNASLTYDNPDFGTSAGLFYNLIGETIASGAARGLNDAVPNVVERRYATLDLTISQKLAKRWVLGIKVRNLLAKDRTSIYSTPDGIEGIKSSRPTPRLYSLSLGLKW